ncbi:hypothetical protein H9657_18020 [Cellulomonas sp. Sa3CUA2]|uniref:CopC domain-containing protein n=1 Tax=Cellulomonas avistercoris TaxID=2762242 RepID=A0ABR8QIE2_9CELL|nr:hypothetical protein [Cellulomonas avistercoris]MBD7920174.1 hypothetical protein [Cellulomonas avistercoris]
MGFVLRAVRALEVVHALRTLALGALAGLVSVGVCVALAVGAAGSPESPSVISPTGGPAGAVLASVGAPGTTTVTLDAGATYHVHLAAPVTAGLPPRFDGDATLVAPSGAAVELAPPGGTYRSRVLGWEERVVALVTTSEAGTYTLTVPPVDAPGAWVGIAPHHPGAGPALQMVLQFVAMAAGLIAVACLLSGGLALRNAFRSRDVL